MNNVLGFDFALAEMYSNDIDEDKINEFIYTCIYMKLEETMHHREVNGTALFYTREMARTKSNLKERLQDK